MELVELGRLSLQDWLQLTGREREPFGVTTAGLTFRPKDRHAAFRDRDGTLAAAVGATVATVRVGGGGPFEVVGIGGLIVRRDLRGRDLATPLVDRLRDMIDSLGPERAMLFCEEGLVAGYARRGYARIDAPVRPTSRAAGSRSRCARCGGRSGRRRGRRAPSTSTACRSDGRRG